LTPLAALKIIGALAGLIALHGVADQPPPPLELEVISEVVEVGIAVGVGVGLINSKLNSVSTALILKGQKNKFKNKNVIKNNIFLIIIFIKLLIT
jgi:hypothetical protein